MVDVVVAMYWESNQSRGQSHGMVIFTESWVEALITTWLLMPER